jgi:DNA uptake protein ComE-like DNA-binding protein
VSVPAVWTTRQRRVVVGIVAALAGYLLLQLLRNPVMVSDPPPPDGPRAAELADRVDPNTADVQTLAALPTMGNRRAAEIVDYRRTHAQMYPDGLFFRVPNDLLKLKGFGVATVQNLEPYLVFPAIQKSARDK